ncbi:MAG: aromatic ring-hydroxylating dioxygenase subunit alpha [Dongiaceae bacterium]
MEHRAPTWAPFDAGRFAPVAEDSWTLPADWYFDPAVYAAERAAIFYQNWIYQCHVSQVAKPGDYYVGMVADQSVFIMRDGDGALRAFYNVCSHRAHPLLEGIGNSRLIVCPYHQWCYETNGNFRGARGRDSLEGWIPENAALKEVRLENYGGLLFVNLDRDANPLVDKAGKLLADLQRTCPRMEELVFAERFERIIAANWKTVVDNNHECYHCAANHPALMELVGYVGRSVWSDDGITFSHAIEANERDNRAYKLDRIEQQALFGFVWPTTIPLMFPGTPNYVISHVIPAGPETTIERWDFLFSKAELDEQDRRLVDYMKTTLIPEDVGICERVQKGLHSRGYRQGRFVVDRSRPDFSEHHVHFFQKFVHDALMGAAT